MTDAYRPPPLEDAADRAVRAALRELGTLEPPPDLAAKVMQRVRARAAVAPVTQNRPDAGWWRRPVYWAQGVAAAAVVVATVTPLGAGLARGLSALAAQAGEAYAMAISVGVSSPATGLPAAVGFGASALKTGASFLVALALPAALYALMRRRAPGKRLGLLVGCMLALPVAAAAQSPVPPPPNELWESLLETSNTIRLLALLALGGLILSGVSALALWARAVWAAAMPALDRMAEERSGWLQLFVGVCNAILALAAVAVLVNLGPLKLIAVSLVGCVLGLTLFGLAARLQALGARLYAQAGRAAGPLSAFLSGAGLAVTAFFVPIAGQLFWLGLLLQSFGLALLWLFRRRPTTATDMATEPDLTAPMVEP
ncbi:MAG: hypothetical protein NZ585_11905 [Chloracidobacterium sp.]|nr:hypothetical protein [Chloracidobacterium sp.]MDW8218226.1 hypothetical protein [Acidobacteriota bacterium]